MKHRITIVTTIEDGTEVTTSIELDKIDSWLISDTIDIHRIKVKKL